MGTFLILLLVIRQFIYNVEFTLVSISMVKYFVYRIICICCDNIM